ncbi:ENTP5 diphosphohydrolase, partial [Oxylabes madagascariensis]|nr:ENTP5 diphosphohydrolase [Oxylabes madagascariensis]
MTSSRLPILIALAFSSLPFVLSHSNRVMWFQDFFPPNVCPINAKANTFYGIMFDAGSTGTRIHIYTFVQKSPENLPEVEGEIFESGAETVKTLLDMAVDAVPRHLWKKTPVVLKATAGLRLLSEEKAQALLSEVVKEVFEESPFLVPEDSVGIMDGSHEGIICALGAVLSMMFFAGQLSGQNQQTVGILDLGGASTQITFLPRFEETLKETPGDFLTSFEMFNSTYKLYTHSYLGFGLKAARLATLGALNMEVVDGQMFRSSCLPKQLEAEWHFGGVKYRYGETGFKPCYLEVLKVVKGKLHQPDEIRGRSFYAFSYYYDRAADTNLIDYERGGVLEVRDFERKAKEVCDNMERYNSASPFLCMDLTYITALLKEGFGFRDNTVLQLTKKVNNIETSWTLGATFYLLQSLGMTY